MLRTVVVVGGLLLAANLLVLGARSQDTDPTQPAEPAEIETLIPAVASVIREQEEVGADLRDDLTGVLVIDGETEIPEDQYRRSPDLGIVTFRPGPDRELRAFEPGSHQVTVVWWPRTRSRAEAQEAGETGAYTWEFKVG